MNVLRRNIWSLYAVLLAFGLAALIVHSYLRWQTLLREHDQQQANIVSQVGSVIHAMLLSQETVLDILGRRLTEDDLYLDPLQSQKELDQLRAANPAVLAFGLAKPDGQLMVTSSNYTQRPLPNLMEKEVSRLSFEAALSSDAMVLGRTYYVVNLEDWIVPIRKAIRTSDGQVLAVMTAGLRTSGATRFFKYRIIHNPNRHVSLFRDKDGYLQYALSEAAEQSNDYMTPIDTGHFDTLEEYSRRLMKETGEDVRSSQRIHNLDFVDRRGLLRTAFTFDQRYRLWIVSTTPYRHIRHEYLPIVATYTALLILAAAMLFILFRRVATSEDRRHQDLLHQANHDPLTGLLNRNAMFMRFSHWQMHSRFALMYIDMDRFKAINDGFGHSVGDKVLKEIASRLTLTLPPRAELYRHGGDEFVIITPETGQQALRAQTQRIVQRLQRPYLIDSFNFQLDVSIGIALCPDAGDSMDSVLRAADLAMYEAKSGKDTICFYDHRMQDNYTRAIHLEHQLRLALEAEKDLFMVYQPQVDEQGRLFGVEALVRWQSQELGNVTPDQFIPVAESTGLMPMLGEFVIRRSISDILDVQEKVGQSFQLSINISVSQISQTGFVDSFARQLQELAVSPQKICLEITESLFIHDLENVLHRLERLKELGVQLSMDDFGTGYSSLSMIRQLPLDELKIDRTFVDGVISNEADKQMVRNIIAIGKNYRLKLVAEGIENQEQAQELSSFGCDLFQGYFFGRPMPADQLIDWIRQHS